MQLLAVLLLVAGFENLQARRLYPWIPAAAMLYYHGVLAKIEEELNKWI